MNHQKALQAERVPDMTALTRRALRGKRFSGSRLQNTRLSTDFSKKVTRLEIPVYVLLGVYDQTVPYPLWPGPASNVWRLP